MNSSIQALVAIVMFLWSFALIASSCCCKKILQKYVVKCTLGLIGIAAFVGAIHSITTATAAVETFSASVEPLMARLTPVRLRKRHPEHVLSNLFYSTFPESLA